MTTVFSPGKAALSAERAELARQMREADAQAGIIYDPTMTHEKLRTMVRAEMEAQGIKPEDNVGSRELMRMRYGDDWDKE